MKLDRFKLECATVGISCSGIIGNWGGGGGGGRGGEMFIT